jgi:hypothetical protein
MLIDFNFDIPEWNSYFGIIILFIKLGNIDAADDFVPIRENPFNHMTGKLKTLKAVSGFESRILSFTR